MYYSQITCIINFMVLQNYSIIKLLIHCSHQKKLYFQIYNNNYYYSFQFIILIQQSTVNQNTKMDFPSAISLQINELTFSRDFNSRSRKIHPYTQYPHFRSNQIHTSKYYWWNFIIKNLWEQFRKPSNLYFLIIGIFQILPYTSTTGNVPTMYIPLGIIILVTAIKDLYEDYHRSVADYQQNSISYIIETKQKNLDKILSKDIRVGQVLKILKNQFVPVDGIILNSSSKFAYVQTKNLDGQTNLKKKRMMIDGDQKLDQNMRIEYEQPNINMNTFYGYLENGKNNRVLNITNLCLRGSILKNTQYIYLVALYTGHDTKILLNMNKISQKKSNIQQKLNYLILIIFIIMIILSFIFSALKSFLNFNTDYLNRYTKPLLFLVSIFQWILNSTNLVPISLIITLESVKIVQGKFIQRDYNMKSDKYSTMVNNSNILEDLGVIECIASDKTGTLTKNQLKFEGVSDGINYYNHQSTKLPKQIIYALIICHEVQLNQQNEFEGISQDQICILEHLKKIGIQLLPTISNRLRFKYNSEIKQVRILKNLEFTSQRKKQSTIIIQGNQIILFCKGADSEMGLFIKDSEKKQELLIEVNNQAQRGLRTLVYAKKKIQENNFKRWIRAYEIAEYQQDKQLLNRLIFEIQNNLQPICVTALEDQLQDEIVSTVDKILNAGMKFIIISGDKPETVLAIAKNISSNVQPYLAKNNIYRKQYDDKKFIVFARCTPKQKQDIVAALQYKTLAIGDGANDVSMLTKANIGVGIYGKQGKAAVQAADFGIPEFKFLKRLLFYYGTQINRKNGILVKYNFYKNFLYTIPQFVYGFYNHYSGVYIYQTYLSQLFNLIFTSLPIMFYALLDQHQTEYQLEQNINKSYQLSRTRFYFNARSIFMTLLQSVLIAIITSVLYFYQIFNLSVSPENITIFEASSIYFFFIVIISNLNIFIISKRISLIVVITIVISVAVYVPTLYIICLLSSDIYNSFHKMINKVNMLIILNCLVFSLFINGMFHLIQLIQYDMIKNRFKNQIVPLQTKVSGKINI